MSARRGGRRLKHLQGRNAVEDPAPSPGCFEGDACRIVAHQLARLAAPGTKARAGASAWIAQRGMLTSEGEFFGAGRADSVVDYHRGVERTRSIRDRLGVENAAGHALTRSGIGRVAPLRRLRVAPTWQVFLGPGSISKLTRDRNDVAHDRPANVAGALQARRAQQTPRKRSIPVRAETAVAGSVERPLGRERERGRPDGLIRTTGRIRHEYLNWTPSTHLNSETSRKQMTQGDL